jgi:hypothetical protein
MPKESLQRLYDGVSVHLDIGDYDTFTSKMQNTDSRKRFYQQVSQELNIGDFTQFEAKVSTKTPAIQPKDVFIEPQYSFSAAPSRPKPGVMRTENTRPLPFFNENPETLLFQPGGKKMLQEYGYIITEPEEEITTKEIAQAQNKLFLQREIAKEKQQGLSERDAYKKVIQDIGATPPNVVDLAMEKSITGSVFRIFGMDQTVDISDYPANKLEDLASGAIAMIMPVDAALFSFGGKAANIKQVGKYADKAANILVKKTGMPIGQARVLAKTALQKITGGAGGFAAFDTGRDITSQIEHTGTVDPIQAVAALMKGAVIGGSVGSLGMAGSYFGKSGEFVGEVFGLGTVSPLLEGEAPTVEGYFDAAATIVGLKFLNGYKKYQSDAIIRDVAEVIKIETETSGRPMHEVANKYGQQLKTSLQLTLEGKIPEKKAYTETIILGDADAQGGRVHSTKPERVQLIEDVRRMSENMDALEKSGVEQRILDELQIEIDSKVERLNEVGVGEIEVKSSLDAKETPGTADVRLQMQRRARSEQERLDQELEGKDILNRQFKPDPMLEVPLHPADAGRRSAESIEKQFSKDDPLPVQQKEAPIEPAKPIQPATVKPQVEPPTPPAVEKPVVSTGNYQHLEAPKYVTDFLMERKSGMVINDAGRIGYTESKSNNAMISKLLKQEFIERNSSDGYSLTKKGKEAKSQVAENERLEKDGVSMDHYSQKKVTKDPLMVGNDVLVGEIDGKPAYSNGHYLIKGKPASETVISKQTPTFDSVMPKSSVSDPIAKPIGWYQSSNGKMVVLSDGTKHSAIDGKYYDFIKSKFPTSDFRLTTEGKVIKLATAKDAVDRRLNKVSIYSGGKRVGILMPVRDIITPEMLSKLTTPTRTPVDLLQGQKKAVGIGLQKQYSDLDVTLKSHEKTLQKENLTPIQRERLEQSKQKIEELKRDTQEQAESNGIELQAFFGIPNPRLLKQLFGSSKRKPTKYSNNEIDRLYNNAIARLEKDAPKEEISIKTPAPVGEPMTKTQGWVSKGLNWFTSDMVERVASVGTPTSKEAAELARRAIDIQKETHGKLSKELDIALRASGSGKAAKDLARFIDVDVKGQPVIMSRLHAAIEGLIPVKGKELELVEKHRDLIEKRGRIFEENEIMQEGKDGEVRPFKVMGRNIAPRIMSGEFYRILDTGTGSTEFNTLVNEFAKATGHSPENIKKYFAELRDNMSGDQSGSPTRTTQAEHSRQWKQIPHAIKLNGELIPLVEYRPYEYARRLADTGESRIGVATVFGQELANTSIVNKIKKQIDAEGGSTKEFHEMIRALSGAPVETTYMDVGFTGSKAMRGIKGVYNIIKQTSLSASLIPNIPEILGNVRRFAGAPSMLKSIFKLTKNPIAVNDALETLGAITIDIGNFSVDPNRPISSRVRAINEAQRRGFLYKYINEFQEKLSAVVASDKVERFQKGKGTGKDVIFLREMGFSRADAELMVSGKAPKELYDSVIRRAPAHLTGGAARTGEQSRLERNKIFRVVSAFETYAQMKVRSLSRVVKTNHKVIEEAVNERDYKKLVDSSRAVASELMGSAVSGMATQFLLAYMYGGEDNVEIKWNEVKENPLEFAIESWMYTSFAGLYGSILQSTAEGKLENPLDIFYPWVVFTEATNALMGKGKYTYDEGFDRLWKFNQRFFPANRVIKQFSVAAGFGNKEAQKDDNAIKAYYRWKIKNKYGGRYTSVPDDEIKNFRSNMIKAYKAHRTSQDLSIVTGHALAAIDGTGKDLKSIASSIRGKKLLTKSRVAPGKGREAFNERLAELRRTIGDKAYERLQRHDMLLDAWSDVFN